MATRARSTTNGAPVLSLRGLRKSFGGQIVLDDLDVDLRHGEVALLRGQNGSGKTTLLNILTANLAPDAGTIQLATGHGGFEFRFPFRSWDRLTAPFRFSPETLARHGLGRTWQDTRLFGTQSVADNIAVAARRSAGENPLLALLRPGAVRRQERLLQAEVGARLDRMGIADVASMAAQRVTVGQAKRAEIARCLEAGARVLCLDEPLAGLDSAGVQSVLELLRDLVATGDYSLVIVEHELNIPRILDFVTTVWTLDGGRLQVEDPAAVRASAGVLHTDGPPQWAHAVANGSRVETIALCGGAVLHRLRTRPGAAADQPVLAVEDLVVRRGRRTVIGERDGDGRAQGMSFSLERGDLAVLEAPNGWGKTTLMEALAGLIPTSQGCVKLQGQPLDGQPSWGRRKGGMSMLQARDHAFSSLTVRESLRLSGVADAPERLQGLLGRTVSSLSGGERQRLALACACDGPRYDVCLLDEPFAGLDGQSVSTVCANMAARLDDAAMLVTVPSAA